MYLSRLNSFLATVAAVTATCLGLAAPQEAEAAEPGNVVALGDSYTANPDQVRNTIRGIDIQQVQDYVWGYPNQQGCLQAPNNWPRKLADQIGAPFNDWSCTAQTSYTASERVSAAINAGDIHPGTRSVIVAVGMNDFGPFGIEKATTPLTRVR